MRGRRGGGRGEKGGVVMVERERKEEKKGDEMEREVESKGKEEERKEEETELRKGGKRRGG